MSKEDQARLIALLALILVIADHFSYRVSASGIQVLTPPQDLQVVRTSDTVLTIGPNCGPNALPLCNARFGSVTFQYVTLPATVTLSGSGITARIYLSDASDGEPLGTLVVGNSGASGMTCSAQCTVLNNVTSYPGHSIPLYIWNAAGSIWNPPSTSEDLRSFLSSVP